MKYNVFLSLFLMLILLLQLSEDVVLRVWYQLGNESFTEIFCENIDQPQLECKGKCFIDDAAVQDSKDTSLLSNKISPPGFLNAFLLPRLIDKILKPSSLLGEKIQPYFFIPKEWIPGSVFPPPKVCF